MKSAGSNASRLFGYNIVYKNNKISHDFLLQLEGDAERCNY